MKHYKVKKKKKNEEKETYMNFENWTNESMKIEFSFHDFKNHPRG